MGVPREPIHLVSGAGPTAIRLVGVHSGQDWTERMSSWSEARIRELASLGLSGFVLKARSPSCGLRDVPVHAPDDPPAAAPTSSRGRFADALVGAIPDLPVEDEERLCDPETRRAFLERVRAFRQGAM